MNARNRSAFTLIELLVVIAIIAILSVVVILTLNPAQLLKQSRDSVRLSDLATLSDALGHFLADQSSAFIGTTTVVYVSVPDTSGTCANLGLPTLPGSWTYHCAPSSTLRNVDGTGWLPMNFTTNSQGAPFGTLPADPVNTTSTGLYYAYTPGAAATYDFAAGAESAKQRGVAGAAGKDGGRSWNSFEAGSNLALLPLEVTDGSKDPDLALYLALNENTGSTAHDSSADGANGTLVSSPTWTTTDCAENSCLSFSGSNYVTVAHTAALQPANAITISFWAKAGSLQDYDSPVLKSSGSGWTDGYGIYYQSGSIYFWAGQYGSHNVSTAFATGALTHVAATFDGASLKIYLNGALRNTASANTTISANSAALQIGRGDPGGLNYLWKGTLDDVRIYGRALSADEIGALYAARS